MFFYETNDISKILISKLNDSGFIVITLDKLTNIELIGNFYQFEDMHPKEEAWNVLTPLFVKKYKLL